MFKEADTLQKVLEKYHVVKQVMKKNISMGMLCSLEDQCFNAMEAIFGVDPAKILNLKDERTGLLPLEMAARVSFPAARLITAGARVADAITATADTAWDTRKAAFLLMRKLEDAKDISPAV
ncbi:MAG: hypothetical protein Q7V63_05215 [Gammaproteobacteria bacterium]|nr:hypothetical protein [Gammaproteobacteria bacterium]